MLTVLFAIYFILWRKKVQDEKRYESKQVL
jgi:hypothetical protein